jgi:hypothetical protein
MHCKLVTQYNPLNQSVEMIDVEVDTIPSDWMPWSWDHFAQCPIYAPVNIAPLSNSFNSHLNHKRKVAFECDLAYSVLKNSFLFLPLLHRIGSSIKSLILSEEQQITDTAKKKQFQHVIGKIFRHVLYPSHNAHFGRLDSRANAPRCNEIYRTGLTILAAEKRIEHLLTVFLVTESILKFLTPNEQIQKLLQEIHEHETLCRHSALFQNRGRYELQTQKTLSTRLGIGDDSLELAYQINPHTRPIEHLRRDHVNVSTFAFEAYQKEIPFVGGPSAHMAKLLASVMPLAKAFSADEKQQYALCCSAFLIAAGAHSFHETMTIAKLFGLSYQDGLYDSALPDSFRASAAYQKLLLKFPDIIKTLANPLTIPMDFAPAAASSSISEAKVDSNNLEFFKINRVQKRKQTSSAAEINTAPTSSAASHSNSAAAEITISSPNSFNNGADITSPARGHRDNQFLSPSRSTAFSNHLSPHTPLRSSSSLPQFSSPASSNGGSGFSLFNSPGSLCGSNLFNSPNPSPSPSVAHSDDDTLLIDIEENSITPSTDRQPKKARPSLN